MARKKKRTSARLGGAMFFALLAGGAFLILAAVAWPGRSAGSRAAIEVQGQPRLKTDHLSIDLGDVRLGETVEASFVLTNVGDQPLRLVEAPYIEVVEGC